MENKLIKQMTNEQKAIDIAQWDGWILPTPHSEIYQNGDKYAESYELTKYYLYDLNYLMPVAVNVYRELDGHYTKLSHLLENRIKGYIMSLDKPSGTYQQLFDAVYEAIVYLENQNQ